MKRVLIGILVLVITLSCKDKNNSELPSNNKKNENAIKEEKGLLISLEATVEKEGKFILYYLLKNEKDISESNSIVVNINPSDSNQKFDFQFDKDIYPERFLLKLKDETQYQKLKFNSLSFSLNKRSFSIDGSQFYQFFNPNKFIDYNRDESIATTKVVDGKYNPTFISRLVLEEKVFFTIY